LIGNYHLARLIGHDRKAAETILESGALGNKHGGKLLLIWRRKRGRPGL